MNTTGTTWLCVFKWSESVFYQLIKILWFLTHILSFAGVSSMNIAVAEYQHYIYQASTPYTIPEYTWTHTGLTHTHTWHTMIYFPILHYEKPLPLASLPCPRAWYRIQIYLCTLHTEVWRKHQILYWVYNSASWTSQLSHKKSNF